MGEGRIGGILGEDEKPGVDAPETAPATDSFAAAIAARLSAIDPQVAKDTSAYLLDQSRLLKIQAQHLNDEHELRLSHLRGQNLGQRLRIAFQLFVALVATVIGVGGAILIDDAVSSRRVVVDAFQAPPALAARGVSGTVVAGALLDELTRMRTATRTSAAAKRDLSSAWAHEVRVSLPDSGISLGELSALLRERFGHDLHIGGDLVQTGAGGLALTVRGNGVAPKTFTGSADDLDRLSIQAAQYVYAESQPLLWAIYLENEFRFAEEVAFIKSVYSTVAPADRPYLLNSWANAQATLAGNSSEISALYREAIRLKPDYWVAYSNLVATLYQMGREEEAWQTRERFSRIANGDSQALPYLAGTAWIVSDQQTQLGSIAADSDANAGLGTTDSAASPNMAVSQVLLHDTAAAGLTLQTGKFDDRDPAGPVTMKFARGLLELETGDVAGAVRDMEGARASLGNPLIDTNVPANISCWTAVAEEAAGHPDKADAAIRAGGRFVDCYRFRADFLDGRGDWTSAQKGYAEAVALAPDLAAAYYSWGVALMRHGDLEGAEAKLKDANQRGPHWADPLKAWGDVLAKQGKIQEALAKYDEALRYAPNWAQLRHAREAAEKQAGGS
jgi:tetratricopeptide (TPR) repeat protein